MAFELFSASALRVKVVHVVYVLLQALVWIGCCAAFGSQLFKGIGACGVCPGFCTERQFHFYSTSVIDNSDDNLDVSFDSIARICNGPNRCVSGGRALIAFSALAFTSLILSTPLSLMRMIGLSPLSFLSQPRLCLLLETVLHLVSTVCLFFGLVVYGSTCYHEFQSNELWRDVHATGYAYYICCFFFMLAVLVLIYSIRANRAYYLGPVQQDQALMGTMNSQYAPGQQGGGAGEAGGMAAAGERASLAGGMQGSEASEYSGIVSTGAGAGYQTYSSYQSATPM